MRHYILHQPNLRPEHSLPPLELSDLRRSHTSLTLRPHAQHGLSVTRRSPIRWTPQNADLNEYVLCVVRFPISRRWHLKGHLFDATFMFPDTDADHTYRLLLSSDVDSLAADAERSAGLDEGTLGCVTRYATVRAE